MVKAREIEGLECGACAARGMRLVLLTRLEEMCAQREAILGAESVDGVHDMRVASRRLRSALRDFGPRLSEGRRLKEARAELKRLADVLGAVRDEDVAVAALEKLREEAPDTARAGLAQLADERRGRREKALDALARELDVETFKETRRQIEQAFEAATDAAEGEGDEESFGDLGRRVVARSWEELRERGADIYRPLKSKRLHRLRIRAKRLRYSLELFAACFGDEPKRLARELAALQKALGNLHDCDEWVEECGGLLSSCERAEEESARRAAALWLLEHFLGERGRHYAEALAAWRVVASAEFGPRLAEIFGFAQRAP
jgi:CHAD domain-containing protein